MNRFDVPISSFRRQVDQQWLPNTELLAKALQQQQGGLDAARTLSEIPVDALEGADTEYAANVRKNLASTVDELTNIYKNQGVAAGARARSKAIRDIKRMQLPGGDVYELAQRKKQFSEYQKTQAERLQKGEITPAQYYMAVTNAKNEYDKAGGYGGKQKLNLAKKMNQVDFDEFANDFLDNLKASSDIYGSFKYQPETGQIYYDKTKVDELTAQKVFDTLSSAYMNAASKTGQLSDEYAYRKQAGLIEDKDIREDAKSVVDLAETVDLTNPDSVKALQKQLVALGYDTGGVDGKMGEKTKNAIAEANKLAGLTDNQYETYSENLFKQQYVNQLAKPYAEAKAYKDIDKTLQNFGRTPDAEEKYAKARKKGETFELRIENVGLGVNLPNAPKTPEKFDETYEVLENRVSELQNELSGVTDPQRYKLVEGNLKWTKMQLDKLDDFKQQYVENNADALKLAAANENANTNIAALENKMAEAIQKGNIAKQEQGADSEAYLYWTDEYNKARMDIAEFKRNQAISGGEGLENIKQYSAKDIPGFDEWLETKADNRTIQVDGVSLSEDEAKAIKRNISVDSWTILDENGPVEDKSIFDIIGANIGEKSNKKLLGDNIEVSSISKGELGEFGNVITLVDKNTNKTYLAAAPSSNVAQLVGENIMNDAKPGSNQYVVGLMLSQPTIKNVASQLLDFSSGDTRNILIGNTEMGTVKKSTTPSGVLFEYTVPEGFEDAGKVIPFNKESTLSLQVNKLYKALEQAKQNTDN